LKHGEGKRICAGVPPERIAVLEGVPALTPSVPFPAARRVWRRSYQATWPKNVLIACALFLVMSLKIRINLIIGERPSKVFTNRMSNELICCVNHATKF
jgi:hypothetical protein